MPTRTPHWTKAAPWIAIAIAVAVLLLDQLTKVWAEANLTTTERIDLIGTLIGLQLAYNPGAAFSIGEGSTWIFTILSAVGAAVAAWFAWRTRSRAWAICLGLLLGGATTHFLDRLLRAPSFGQGHVVDFIAYFDWFIGNVADIALFSGAVMLVVLFALGIESRPHPADASADEASADETSTADASVTEADAPTDAPADASADGTSPSQESRPEA